MEREYPPEPNFGQIDQSLKLYRNAVRRRRIKQAATALLLFASLALVYKWDALMAAFGPRKEMVYVKSGEQVQALSKAYGAPPPVDRRMTKNEIEPTGEASHVIYPVYFGTDRVPSAPFSGVSRLTLVLSLAAMAAIVVGAGAWWSGRRKFGTVLFVAAAGCIFGGWSPWPTKANPVAAGAYGDARGALQVGVCTVSIPRSHKEGALEAPSLLTFELREDPNKHIILQRVEQMPYAEFAKGFKEQVEMSSWPEAIVFVHGYNVTFEDAARRTAQIAYDLRFGGVSAMFSWPSVGGTLAYTWDEQSAQYATPDLVAFVKMLAKEGALSRVHVIAHSMGNRCVFEALKTKMDLGECRLDRCVLAAPDIDRDVFKREFALIGTGGTSPGHLTLYASDKDKALKLSQDVHRYPRAGDANGGVVLVDGLESVEASALETDYLGHSYVGASVNVLADLKQIIEDRLPAAKRNGMKESKVGTKSYWTFVP